ncbi:MAG: Hsp70 family protein [Vulcanimicrobiota bacterium]
MRSCREPSCIAWPLQASDQYCSWCGRRLVEVEAGFESKQGDAWIMLDPPVLNRERPPSLRLRVAHCGEAGHLRLQPQDFRISAPWLELDYSSLGDAPLKPGDAVQFPVRKLKVPGPEDLPHEIRITVGQQEVRASTSLTFVPAPEFHLELSSSEVVLSSDSEPFLEGALVLRRGRICLETPPALDPPWARLEVSGEEAELEMDAVERPRYAFRFRFASEELAQLRQRSADQVSPLQRHGKVKFAYLDRGQKGSSGREILNAELPLSLQFILAPELYVEPFGYEQRRDWFAVLGLRHPTSFALTLHNGPPGSAPRQELVVQQLKVRDLDANEDFPVESAEPPPWTVQSDSPRALKIRLPLGLRRSLQAAQGPAIQRRLQLIPVSNDPVQRLLHLRFQAEAAEPFPGYLAVDLGTTATCAALVSETKQVERVVLDGQLELPSAICYLRWGSDPKWEVGQKALRRRLEPAAQRSVITQAKRRVGDDDNPFEVVPLDEPGETVILTATQALSHLYREVLDQALRQRLASGTSEVLIERMLITHPSRFSLRQIELIKQAAHQALHDHWFYWTGQDRHDLPHPITLHEPTGAAFHYLKDWQNLAQVHSRLSQDQLQWHLMVYDLGGGTLDVTLLRLDSLQQPIQGESEQFAYQVQPSVVGATGERWFGGQDVTEILYEKVEHRLDAVLGDWCWPDPEQGGAQRVAWQRNRNLLMHWCERFKLDLVGGQGDSWSSFPSLTVMENGRERLVTVSHWRQSVQLPGLAELEEGVQPLLQRSLKRVQEMLERHQLKSPQVVLRVGKASQLPCVQLALRQAFPDSLLLAPELLKGCVVEGACVPPLPGLPGGVQLSRGQRRPGVRFRWKPQDSYLATTSRLGIQVADSGETWFQEVLPEGTPIPAEGLEHSLDGLYLEAGPNTLVLLENAGHLDALKDNPDIQMLCKIHFEVPALELEQMEQFRLRFRLSVQGQLSVWLEAPGWEGAEIARLDGSQLGKQY